MRLKILPKGVLGQAPVILDASLVLAESDGGTLFMVAGEYGPGGSVRASHSLDEDFEQTLRALGITQVVICDKLVLPKPPPGAVLLKGPNSSRRKEWPDG